MCYMTLKMGNGQNDEWSDAYPVTINGLVRHQLRIEICSKRRILKILLLKSRLFSCSLETLSLTLQLFHH